MSPRIKSCSVCFASDTNVEFAKMLRIIMTGIVMLVVTVIVRMVDMVVVNSFTISFTETDGYGEMKRVVGPR